MSNYDKEGLDCISETDLVTLLYSEVAEVEASKLEEHLSRCSSCIEEFAALSEARLSAYEWNRDEFARLDTPVIAIDYAGANTPISWLERVSAGFAALAQYGTVTVALGLIAFALTTAYLIFADRSAQKVAINGSQPVAVKPDPETSPGQIASREVIGADKPDSWLERKQLSTVVKVRKFKSSSVRTADVANVNKHNSQIRSESLVARQQTAPRLTSNAEPSDNSLRLAELFSELDANE